MGKWNGEGLGRGRSVYKQPGTRVDKEPPKEEGFQVSRRDSGEREVVKGNQQGELARGINKGLRHDLVSSTCMYVS